MIRRAIAALSLIFVLVPVLATAATRYDPRLRFRTISTAVRHSLPSGRGSPRAQAGALRRRSGVRGRRRRRCGGGARPDRARQSGRSREWLGDAGPYNTIEISVAVPTVESVIGNSPDWCGSCSCTSTHIAHLSRAGGWLNGLRWVSAGCRSLFPNLYQPVWAIEGHRDVG